jgi:hypothetical protein
VSARLDAVWFYVQYPEVDKATITAQQTLI